MLIIHYLAHDSVCILETLPVNAVSRRGIRMNGDTVDERASTEGVETRKPATGILV